MLVGETTMAGDIPPVECGAPVLVNPATAAKRKIPPGDKDKKARARMASRLIGEDSRDGYVIPDNAKEVTGLEVTGDGLSDLKSPDLPGEKTKNPYSGEEPLLLPVASLVAPDVTPEALYPLDPTQLPGADAGKKPESAPVAPMVAPTAAPIAAPPVAASPALNVVLGKGPEMSTESALSKLPGIPTPAAVAAQEAVAAAPAGEAVLERGKDMPEHKQSNAAAVMNAFARFVPRGKEPTALNG